MTTTVLIVDDNERVYSSLKPNFEHFGYRVVHAPDGRSALKVVRNGEISVVLLDIMLGKENGITVLQQVKESAPRVPVVMITGYASVDTAVQAMKMGAYDYVKKPLDFERLLKVVENAAELYDLSEENAVLKRRIEELSPRICLENSRLYHIVEHAKKLAQTDIPVLIVGENGSGKEVIADFIHSQSSRSRQKMHKINCAAFPESLLDNELFGHEKGAYTGADQRFCGIFEQADNSTLFLDEIGDMPSTIQAKILRVIQHNEFRRIGGTEQIRVNVRFIAATNQDLQAKIAAGAFREDLYFRLNAAIIEVPPLRERHEDIPLLVDYFLAEFSRAHGKRIERVAPEVMERFLTYLWPGNVRELKNTINYGVAITDTPIVKLVDLPPSLLQTENAPAPRGRAQEIERELIARTLSECRFNKKRTAELLGISRKTLYAKLSRYAIPA